MRERWEIPKSWLWTTAGDIAEIIGGATPSTTNGDHFTTPGGGHPWITPADLTRYYGKSISRGRRDLTDYGVANSAVKLLPSRSVLFSSRAPIGYAVVNDQPVYTNQGFKSLALRDEAISPWFIRYYLASAKEYAESLASGSTFRELSGSRMADLCIPLAPTDEQHRIVAKLDALQSRTRIVREALAAIPALLDHYQQSVLVAAFSIDAPFERPLGEIAHVDWGDTSLTKASYVEAGYPAYSAAGQDGMVAEAQHEGDGIVLSAIGARCGRCFFASGRWTAIKNTITIIPRNRQEVSTEYLFLFLNRGRAWTKRGGAQPFITLGDSREILVPLPSLAHQVALADQIRRDLHRVADLHFSAESLAAQINLLDQSILATAFRGALVPQDPADEPASVLLERIRAACAQVGDTPSARPRRQRAPAATSPQRAAEPATPYRADTGDSYAALCTAVRDLGSLSNADAQRLTHLDAATVRPLLQRLVAEGHARIEGRKRGTRYVAV